MSSRSVGARGAASLKKATRKAVKSAALCAFVISMPQLALAADTTINTAETTTQGPTVPELNGGDTLTIGPAGSVTVTGNDTPGISGTGVNNTVNNNGTIVTRGNATGTGSGVSGIVTLGGSATINNAGLIETYGNGAVPFGGSCAYNASGICAEGGGNTITNSGTINTYGSVNARGIYATGGNNTIRNTGTVTSRLSQGIGVIGGSNIVINSGIVLAAGDGDAAIRLTGGSNTLTNQGSVISQAGNSIEFVGSGNTLNLGNSSFLSGNVSLGTGTQINITTGASFSKLINYTGTLSGISASGSVPAFINTSTNQVATYDPTLFAASSDALGDMTSTISSLTPGRFNGSDKDHPLWVRGFGMASSYEGTDATLDRSYNYSGVAIGYDFKRSKDLSLGVLGGYGQTSLWANAESTQSFNTNSDDGFLGLYGQKRWKNVAVDFALYGGLQSFQQQRYVNDNLAYLGNSSANASYQGWWIAPEAGITYNAGEVNGWSFLPTARLRYAQQWMGGYTETGGGSANATVNGRSVAIGQSFIGIGTRKTMKTRMGKDTKMVIDGQVGYVYRGVVGDDTVNVTMIGQSQLLSTESSSRNAVAVSAGVTLDLSSAVALKIRGDFAAGGGMQYGSGGWAGLSVKF
jgi:uncharacterized protein with beta-barrel porin domain